MSNALTKCIRVFRQTGKLASRVHIHYTISWYRLQIRRPCDIVSTRDRTISCTNARLMLQTWPNTHTMGTGNNYLRGGHLKGPHMRPVGNRPPPLPNTHIVWSVLCPLNNNILPVQAAADDDSKTAVAEESFLGGQHRNAVPTPVSCIASGQQRCADHKSLIRISPSSSTKDPRPQAVAICNLESALRVHLNATLYS